MSKHPMRSLTLALLLAGSAPAQDLLKVAPEIAKVEYEDADIRVIRSHYEPGASSAMHSHPPRVVVTVLPAALRLSKPDGSSMVISADPELRPVALAAETHAVTNTGSAAAENIEIEFKRLPRLGALRTAPLENPADPDSLLHEPNHHWLMETPWFRVVEARIPPGETTQWHRHRHPDVVVRLRGSEVATQKQGAEWSQPANATSGSVEFEKRDAPMVHRVRNSGAGEYRVVLVELLGPAGGN
jgi:quercetin dioxygenase-like cupin family protein